MYQHMNWEEDTQSMTPGEWKCLMDVISLVHPEGLTGPRRDGIIIFLVKPHHDEKPTPIVFRTTAALTTKILILVKASRDLNDPAPEDSSVLPYTLPLAQSLVSWFPPDLG